MESPGRPIVHDLTARVGVALLATLPALGWLVFDQTRDFAVGAYPSVALAPQEAFPLRLYLFTGAAWVASIFATGWGAVAACFRRDRWVSGACSISLCNTMLVLPLLAGNGAFVEYYRWPAFGGAFVATLVVSYWLSRVISTRRYPSTTTIDPWLAHPLLVATCALGVFFGGNVALGRLLHLGWLYPALLLLIVFWISGAGMVALTVLLPTRWWPRPWMVWVTLGISCTSPTYFGRTQSFVRIRMLVEHHRSALSRLLAPATTARAETYKVVGKFWPSPAVTRKVPPPPAIGGGSLTRRSSVVFFVIDALRRDAVGAYGSTANATPNLDRLAERGTRYLRAYSPSAGTGYSIASILSGLPPAVVMNTDAIPLFLGEALRGNGYQTSSTASPYELQSFLYPSLVEANADDLGFGAVITAKGIGKEAQDASRVDGLIARLAASTAPRFEYVHLMGAHGPFAPKEAAVTYQQAVRTADAELGRFLEFLDRSGAWDRTSVFVFGDHGEGLGEHGMFAHSQALYEEQVAVPLVTHVPGVPPRVEANYLSLFELPDLVFQALGSRWPFRMASRCSAPEPSPTGAGGYALQELFIRETLTWRAVRVGDHAVHHRYLEDRRQLYQLSSDPGELADISSSAAAAAPLNELVECIAGQERELERTLEAAAVQRVRTPE